MAEDRGACRDDKGRSGCPTINDRDLDLQVYTISSSLMLTWGFKFRDQRSPLIGQAYL
jgi:hypothetical protein